MEKKKLQSVSIAALIVSILPLAALAPSLLHLSLSDGVRTAWAGANIVFCRQKYCEDVPKDVTRIKYLRSLEILKKIAAVCGRFLTNLT